MSTSIRAARFQRGAILCAVFFLGLAVPAMARSVRAKKQLARTEFERAEQLREALTGKLEKQRARRDYNRVIEAYRKVYHTAPTSNKADASVTAVAELLAEAGRRFDDDKSFKDAIAQYEFLRREYPGSKYRFDALFTVAQIYREDLADKEQARSAFNEFLKRYPHHRLAEDAKAALAEMEQEAAAAKTKSPFKPPKAVVEAKKGGTKAAGSGKNPAKTPIEQEESAETPTTQAAQPVWLIRHPGKLPLVTGIRHWSTPDYTRVAIDLEQEVKYEAGRVPSPDRIFFDLQDTKLASELKGKSFDVQEGFLHKIRVAQFNNNMTRVVFEVDEVAEYSAFLLPNPYRLIIDVHGKNDTKLQAKTDKAVTPGTETSVPAPSGNSAPQQLPQVKASLRRSDGAPASNKSKPVVQAKSEDLGENDSGLGLKEIATLTDTNKEIKATSKPTSQPVVQTVTPRETVSTKETLTQRAILEHAERPGEDHGKNEAVVSDEQFSGKVHSSAVPRNSLRSSSRRKNLKSTEVASIHTAQPTASGDRSLIRALGLKIGRIVVDPGHGGHDTGTIGPNGLMEKDLVLDVALRLGKLLEKKLGADVVYTRDDDTFIPLETRTAIANKNQADLFISIHANSSSDLSARGVETYYLNFSSSPDALEVAARENAVSEKSIHELQDLVKKIALKEKIEESREFAQQVQKSLHAGLIQKNRAIRDRGVKKAPFVVLIGANMPSILAEISFVSNPTDERRLQTAEWRQKIADSLYKGLANYVGGLSGVKLAQRDPAPIGEAHVPTATASLK